MPAVHRQGDLTCGEGCFLPQVPQEWSPNVKANGKGVVRQGDARVIHCCPPVCHPATYTGGSSVRVNGKPVQRIGSSLSCGDTVCQGSPNVNVA